VVTRRALAPLERLAGATGGQVFRSDAAGALAIESLAQSLHRDAGRAGSLVVRRERAVQVLPLAAIAFALLLLEGLPVPRAPRRLRRAAAATALVLLAAGPLAPEAALRLQRAGIEKLERGDVEGARRALSAAALATRETALAALAYYHLGVAQLAAGDLEAARLAFFDALALDPEDAMARFDLEWTLAALARRPPPSPAPAASQEREPKLPRPAPEAPRKTQPEPGSGERREAAPAPPALGAEERQRLLDRVPDDPSRALRLTARSGATGAASRAEGPAW
jgi:tetratricopeptide (TPR) repeat protein